MKTNGENIRTRLCLRFACLLLFSTAMGALLFGRASLALTGEIGLLAFLPIALSLLAPLLSVPNTYLSTLSILYGCLHGTLLARCVLLVRVGSVDFLTFNAALFLVLFSLLLFLLSAAKACQFAFEHPARDTALLLRRPFLKYTAEAVLYIALSASVYYLWSRLLVRLPL